MVKTRLEYANWKWRNDLTEILIFSFDIPNARSEYNIPPISLIQRSYQTIAEKLRRLACNACSLCAPDELKAH